MEAGTIGTTGNYLEIEGEDGEKKRIPEPEEIHTFLLWKDLGFSIKRGQKSTIKIRIWKHAVKKAKEGEETDTERMFMKTASFFTWAQVEPSREEKGHGCTGI